MKEKVGVSRQTVGEECFRQRNIQGLWVVEIRGMLVFWMWMEFKADRRERAWEERLESRLALAYAFIL